ncbi:SDR family oxidoreductase [Planctomonas sp. JC2975]|uniref:SDR family NAD(P)-dependent oxidoreductase n=1 Tax=Planctomonas sp. JC2975 TaxID=2729626 RepID=UPI001472F63A|nr:SDR family NAD(P)-dependent oxidoreductase [Planctomonas sp. JC2975]NNC13625.1 SDR family oxidoreductase [Planctomonas sp. JC2975]
MLLDLSDKVVVVSGGGRGIGRTIVDRFVSEKAKVVAIDIAYPDELAPGVVQLTADITDPSAVKAAIDRVLELHGRVDVLINNAGILIEGPIETFDPAHWKATFDVNVLGTFLLSQAVIPSMKAVGAGRIINAASFAAIVPSIGSAAYAASKAAVVQFTRVLAGELGPWNITVNCYAPGMIPTAMNGFADMPEGAQARLLDTLSLRRWERADDVADLLCFLASDAAGYITGALHDVSGGKLATQIPSRAYEGLSD